jgi:hypothetical protein
MEIVFVHGINQEREDPDALKADWTGWLRKGMSDPAQLSDAKIAMPFYGKVLGDLVEATRRGAGVAQGAENTPDEAEDSIGRAMDEIAKAAGISAPEIAKEERAANPAAIEQGWFSMNRRINAIARLLERHSPIHGSMALTFVTQAYMYLKYPDIQRAVDDIVRPALLGGPKIVLGHSLGSVVTFRLLREIANDAPVEHPLYITMGSPLALRAVSALVGVPFEIPKGVVKWINAVDPDDSVTLGKPLDRTTFCDGVLNLMDVTNTSDNGPHAVEGYLKDQRIGDAVGHLTTAS